ncbi:MAG: hypothetical protein A2283_00850 [Lentisphaerae bacterium RIFOXYA12_FULL_48_11]|nr:MAG: hypothetical protein A2283_00850 [Lentisphaerae bacterium RIFOXYA12_FULL_48_11]
MAEKLQLHKIVISYLLIGLVGSLLVVTACSGYQAWRIKQIIVQADSLFKANSVDAALGRLLQAELWATRYPNLAVELNVAAIKCHVKRRDIRSAEDSAKKIYECRYNVPRRSRSFAEMIQDIPNSVITSLWKNKKLNRFSGYEELITAVRQSGNYDRLVSLSKDIIALDPTSALAQSVKAYIPVAPSAIAQEKSIATQQVTVVTNKIEEVPKTIEDYRKLLDRHMAIKAWDKILKDCDAILAEVPDDASVLEIRKLAVANGMRWSVVKTQNAPAYDTSGKFLKAMPVGTMLDLANVIKTTREELALCSVASGGNSPAATFLMRCNDLAVYFGDVNKIPEEDQKLFKKEASLDASIVALRAKLAASSIDSQNPFSAEYKAAKQAHEAYWAKVRAVQQKRDNASNSDDKMRYSDELRQLKGEDIRLGMALETAKKKYDQATTTASANIKSPELDAMISELADVRERIKSITK